VGTKYVELAAACLQFSQTQPPRNKINHKLEK